MIVRDMVIHNNNSFMLAGELLAHMKYEVVMSQPYPDL